MAFIVRYKIFIAALISGCIFLCSCENDDKVLTADTKNAGLDEATNVVVRYSVGGKLKAILTGPLMYRSQGANAYIEFPKTLHVDFYGEDGKLESKLDALYAKYRDTESKVFLRDSVKVINVKGDTLHCDELYWDRSRTGTEFYTDKPVRIRTKTQIIDGVGMDARQDFKEWHIVKSTGFIKVPATEFPD